MSGIVRRFVLFLCGPLMLVPCAAVTIAVVSLIRSIQPDSYLACPPPVWAFLGGLCLWLLLYAFLPSPVRTYVFAHELTHALWGYMTGARVFGIRISKGGGSVAVSKNNMLITLAPYFFPLYTVIVIGAYGAISLFYDTSEYELVWLALVGFTWGFHIVLTVAALLEPQNDVREYGRLLSYATVYFMNVLGVGVWIVAVSRATVEQFVDLFARGLKSILMPAHGFAVQVVQFLMQ